MIFRYDLEGQRKYCWLLLLLILLLLSGCSNVRYLAERELVIDEEIPKFHHSKPFFCTAEEEHSYSKAAVAAFNKAEKQLYSDAALKEKIAAYDLAAKAGHEEALTRTLQLYLAYNEIDRKKEDPKEGPYAEEIVYALKALLDKKMPIGYAYLAQFKKMGIFTFKDERAGLDFLYYASSLGSAKAQAELADYYLYKQGNYKKGLEIHSCASRQNYIPSFHAKATAINVYEKNYPKMLSQHLQSAGKGSIKSLRLLRSTFRDGLYGYEKDQDLAMCFHGFIEEYASNPKRIHGLEEACPLPDHPDLKDGLAPLKESDYEKIKAVEKQFNPNRRYPKEDRPPVVRDKKQDKKIEQLRRQKMRSRINREVSRF